MLVHTGFSQETNVGEKTNRNRITRSNENSFGVKIGYNLSGISNFGGGYKSGINAGFVTESFLNKNKSTSISLGLSYSMQGATGEVPEGGLKGERASLLSQYINIPVLVKVYTRNNRFSFDLGFQFGYLVNMRESASNISIKYPKDWYNSIDVSYCYGASYNFSKVTLSARIISGLTNVINMESYKSGILAVDPESIVKDIDMSKLKRNNNRVIEISMSFKF